MKDNSEMDFDVYDLVARFVAKALEEQRAREMESLWHANDAYEVDQLLDSIEGVSGCQEKWNG